MASIIWGIGANILKDIGAACAVVGFRGSDSTRATHNIWQGSAARADAFVGRGTELGNELWLR
jgi:hypothetical protein